MVDLGANDLSHSAFLERLLGLEVDATAARRHAGRLRLAGFPAPWRLEDFDFDAQPTMDRKLINDLATLRFIDEASNVLLVGPPGVGKTHLAIAFGPLVFDADTASTTPPPPPSPPAATAQRSRDGGPPPYGSSPPRSCSSSTSSATYPWPAKPPPRCSKSSRAATSKTRSC
jgi:hypothetical protein